MKTKFKDFLLYSMACIGAVSLFLSAYQPQQATSTSLESHVWQMQTAERQGADNRVYLYNKVTGEVRKYSSKGMANGKLKDQYYKIMSENKEGEK